MAEEMCTSCSEPCISCESLPIIGSTVVIDGCEVNFPFEPYTVQKDYMSKIIKALDKGGVAALESPTGTGKTSSLLCSTLAWVEKSQMQLERKVSDGEDDPDLHKKASHKVVYYASRTHSQLSKAMAELRRTHYKNLNAAILGSREQMCIHPDRPIAESLSSKNTFCRNKRLGRPMAQPSNDTSQQSTEVHSESVLVRERRKVGRFPDDSDQGTDHENRSKEGVKKPHWLSDDSGEETPEATDASRIEIEIEKTDRCSFFLKTEKVKKNCQDFYKVKDIEDLVALSEERGCCPFYLSRYLQEGADIVFLPYNYIFTRSISKTLHLKLDGGIVILDEAHNIDKVCEEAASVSLSSTDIGLAIRDVQEEMERIGEESSDSDCGDYRGGGRNGRKRVLKKDKSGIVRTYCKEDLIFMEQRLTALEREFLAFMKTVKEPSREFPLDILLDILTEAEITEENYIRLENLLNDVQDVVEVLSERNKTRRKGRKSLPRTFVSTKNAGTLHKVADYIAGPYYNKVFSPENRTSFVMHTELEYPVTKRNRFGQAMAVNTKDKPKGITIHVWCLNPALGMRALWNAHSVILTSGTLSPLKNVILELGLEQFPSCVQNRAEVESAEFGHVVPSDQFMIISIGRGPTSTLLQYDFKNKENVDYWEELGQSILNFIRLIPDGVLVFFPSYQALEKASRCWQTGGLWERLCAIKPLFAEGTDKLRFKSSIDGYRTSVDEGKGGVMMGICRGKMSEGIDFKDQYGRAVIVCGLPYPPLYDPQVKYKKRYIDSLNLDDLKGQDWYRAEATKAINQAIGRVIRHANDIGCILLCDIKFQQPQIAQSVSAWLRPVSSMRDFGKAVQALSRFFRRHSNLSVKSTPTKGPRPDVDSTPAPVNGQPTNDKAKEAEEVTVKEITSKQDTVATLKRFEERMDSLENKMNRIERKIDRNNRLILKKLTLLHRSMR